MMRESIKTWAVVLAAGDGNRLRELTTTPAGETIPKQFCSFQRHTCLLDDAIKRAQSIVMPHHVCSVVAAKHRRWWANPLNALHQQNIFVQPSNRGTAHGILLALLQIHRRAPNSVVIMLPADHYVRDEETIARSLRIAANLAADHEHLVYIVGVQPDRADDELGYVVPSGSRSDAASEVLRFVEKPAVHIARELIKDGALWNTFIFAGSVRALLSMFEGRFAPTLKSMRDAIASAEESAATDNLELVYQDLETSDFSKDVLERHEQMLQVLRAPPCGWTDLGTPTRVAEVLRRLPRAISTDARSLSGPAHLDLAIQRGRVPIRVAS
jgi:mannose-1-phosphate guanylyltransferase